MAQPQTLADLLGASELPARLEDVAGDAKAFCEAVLNSAEFRQYVVSGLLLGSIPAAILSRVMDVAGWPKSADVHKLVGANGGPIEMVTEVRRVIVDPSAEKQQQQFEEEEAARARSRYTTH